MTRIQIPKEYYLENPAYYSDSVFKNFFKAVGSLRHFGGKVKRNAPKDMYLFSSYFRTEEETDIAYNLLIYVFDKFYPDTDEVSVSSFLPKYMDVLFEAGFFG